MHFLKIYQKIKKILVWDDKHVQPAAAEYAAGSRKPCRAVELLLKCWRTDLPGKEL